MKELVEYIAKSLVNSPDAVVVTQEEGEEGITLKLQVADEDKGRIMKTRQNGSGYKHLIRVKLLKPESATFII